MKRNAGCFLLVVLIGIVGGCSREVEHAANSAVSTGRPAAWPAFTGIEPCSIILVPPPVEAPGDEEIIRLQQKLQSADQPADVLERLGWAFVKKARATLDDFYYTLAEHCATCMDAREAGSCAALLLHGHALHNQHRFKEAEPIARKLVARRGLAFDYGLLSDTLMELGRLDEAAAACQAMVDLRPGLESYSRGAHIRWLKGDPAGAIELMKLAATAATPADPEAAAWVYGRLAFYQLQAGHFDRACKSCDIALQFQTNYAPALLTRGRISIAQGEKMRAVEPLKEAAMLRPLPEYQWALADTLRDAGLIDEAAAVEEQLRRHGAALDPRTFALFLATRGDDPPTALRLAEIELCQRADVFTHDAFAWALLAAGRIDEASAEMQKALSEKTPDARLSFHAAIISAKSGKSAEAQRKLTEAFAQIHLLLPSEQRQLLAAQWPAHPTKGLTQAAGD